MYLATLPFSSDFCAKLWLVGSKQGTASPTTDGEGGIRTRPSRLMLQDQGFVCKPFFHNKLNGTIPYHSDTIAGPFVTGRIGQSIGQCKRMAGSFRDEFLNGESFGNVLEAKVLVEGYRLDCNHHRPHSSLDYMTRRLLRLGVWLRLRTTCYLIMRNAQFWPYG